MSPPPPSRRLTLSSLCLPAPRADRNSILALPWLSAVRVKLNDPAFSSWFMHYHNSTPTDPKCGATGPNGSLHRCTELWHDPTQTPAGGDCGPNIPCGEYVFNFSSANHSVNGQRMLDWYINDYVLGYNGSGHPAVSGYFFVGLSSALLQASSVSKGKVLHQDDHWDNFTAPDDFSLGPTEVSANAVYDMGLDMCAQQRSTRVTTAIV